MRRRELLTLAAGVAAAGRAWAQAGKVYRLGLLVNAHNLALDAFLGRLRDHGYIEGQNLIVVMRFSEGVPERWAELAQELVADKVDAIYVQTTPAALAAKRATSTIPIVISSAIDPVGAGLAASLARPSANVTGVALETPEISAKALSLLKEAVPALSRVAVLWNEANPAFTPVWQALDATAHATGLALLRAPVHALQDFTQALATMVSQHPDAVLVLVDALVGQRVRQIVEFATSQRLPAASTFKEFVNLGGLMSYGPNIMPRSEKPLITSTGCCEAKTPLNCHSSNRQRSSW